MKSFPISRLLTIVRGLQKLIGEEVGDSVPYADDNAAKQNTLIDLKDLSEQCEDCSLTSASDQFQRIANEIDGGSKWAKIQELFPEALNRIEDECKRHLVFFIEPQHAKYYSDAQFFDAQDPAAKKVSTEFPSAAEDIAESGRCLACGRSTACIMHLGRVVEVGLKALAGALGVTPQNDWGKYLSEIDKELQHRFKKAGARTPDEQFYAEAQITIDSVRRAWRNPTMHIDKTYTVERAEEILIAVRSFMRHLATRIHE
jgi:hypothetical protein